MLSEEEIFRIIVIFRFINLKFNIWLVGGRNKLENYGDKVFKVGVNLIIIGNLLIICGNNVFDDRKMINNLGLKVKEII